MSQITVLKKKKTTKNEKWAKPFLKWAGGKTQLLSQFECYYPKELKECNIQKYIEPFFGGGALFFELAQKYNIKIAYLYDINEELILTNKVVQEDPKALIKELKKYSERYKIFSDEEREKFFYEIRGNYNSQLKKINYEEFSKNWIKRAAQIIFLNKTCYNGLFRLNRKGEFNVPFGRYKAPKILDEENILRVSKILEIAKIIKGDFELCEKMIDENTFIYFDPPYRPISQTSSFTSFSKYNFRESEQIRLSIFFARIDKKYGAKLMLSNSDPTNQNTDDQFFEERYKGYNIHKVFANRMINCKGEKRGLINELLIVNY